MGSGGNKKALRFEGTKQRAGDRCSCSTSSIAGLAAFSCQQFIAKSCAGKLVRWQVRHSSALPLASPAAASHLVAADFERRVEVAHVAEALRRLGVGGRLDAAGGAALGARLVPALQWDQVWQCSCSVGLS